MVVCAMCVCVMCGDGGSEVLLGSTLLPRVVLLVVNGASVAVRGLFLFVFWTTGTWLFISTIRHTLVSRLLLQPPSLHAVFLLTHALLCTGHQLC